MSGDFLIDLKYLGVTARLKRLSDALSTNIKELYGSQGVDLEPSWHLVFLLLKDRETCTMSELAEAFRLSQPAATKMVRRMVQKGYIGITRDESDGRKKILRLTSKAKTKLPHFEAIWHAGQKSVRDILKSNADFLTGLQEFEAQLQARNFKDRALKHLGKNSKRKKA